jgi:restriction system protein
LLVPAGIVAIGDSVPEGQLVEAVMLPWFDIISALERDPSYLHQLDWRRVEQLIAGAYTRDGWPEVILTPRSGDGGRDIIVSKPGFGAIRFYDQVKAYGPGQRVSANDARAIFGVVELHQNVSKAVITTTTLFAPGVHQEFKAVMPNRLELRRASSEEMAPRLPAGTPGFVIQQYLPIAPALVREPFHRDGWVYEEKVDGWRIVA